MAPKVELLNPVAKAPVPEKAVAQRLDSLGGKTVGICDAVVDWRSYGIFVERLERLLRDAYNVKGTVRLKPTEQGGGTYVEGDSGSARQNMDEFARKIDCAVVGACF